MPTSSKPISTRGRLIVFEGADGSGKTTISKRLVSALISRGEKCLWTAFPGHEPDMLGAEIYALHHDPRFATAPTLSIQLLHVAAHVEAIERQILPALKAGTWVVLDRYWWSTLAYGLVGKVDPAALRLAIKIEKLQWGAVRPTLAFLVERDLPGLKTEPRERQSLRRIYMTIAERERRRHPVKMIKNDRDLDEAVNQVIAFAIKPKTSRR